MRFVGRSIILNRTLSDLDRFAIDFTRILKKHTRYVIVSGYVSILLGRARVSEDIDVVIPEMTLSQLESLVKELSKQGFTCLNSDVVSDMYQYLCDKIAIRFARTGSAIPNIELRFAKSRIDSITLGDPVTVKVGKCQLVIGRLEMQIAYKEILLKSPKDMEDARHLRMIAKDHLDRRLLEKYRRMLHAFRG